MTPNERPEDYWEEWQRFCGSIEEARALRKTLVSPEAIIAHRAAVTEALKWYKQQQQEQARRAAIRKLFWTGTGKTAAAALLFLTLVSSVINLWQMLGK